MHRFEPTRRDVLRGATAGVATLFLPSLLAACAHGDLATRPVPENPFLAWFGVDEATLRTVLTELTSHGADAADLYFQHVRSTSIALEDGIISRANTGVDLGVGLRVVIGDRVGYAFTEDLSLDAMLGAARTATTIARGGPVAPPQHFELKPIGGYYQVPVAWADVGIDQRLPLVRRAEALTRAQDPRIEKVNVTWTDSDEKILIATLDGRMIVDDRPMTRMYVNVTARQNGVSQSNGSNIAGRQGIDWYTEERIAQVSREAAERTLILFDARRPPAGEMPVALAAGASGILLHEAVGHGMEADFNRKGVSIYADMIGRKVAPDFVNIVDDGTLAGERGALNYDDEGQPCERTMLVEGGVLTSYLHDSVSAKHYGVASTGSGRRESFRHVPMPRMRCTFMEAGPHSREEIIASIDRGIIAETFTNGQVEIGAGDFTFYIKNGWLIEGGKITAPIKDCNIIGNGPAALRDLSMAAADARLDTGGWTCGKDGQGVPVSQGLPTVLVRRLTVGGVNA